MDLLEKLQILADSAKYDVACTSSGVDRGGYPVNWEIPFPAASATPFPPTAGAFPC